MTFRLPRIVVTSERGGRRDRRRSPPSRRGSEGFGLIEILVALTLLMITIVPLAYLMTTVTKDSASARARIGALGVAEHLLEYYNNLALDGGSFPTPGGAPINQTFPVGAITYNTTVTMQWGQTGLDGNLCTVGSVPQIVNVLAVVTWGRGNSVQESTVINPPYGLISPSTGFLAVQVNNAAGVGQSSTPPAQPIHVSISPSPGVATPPSVVPDGGCIFVEANSGSYTVTLTSPTSSPFSYVDDGENTSTTVPVTVPAEGTGYGSTAYDEGGAIQIGYASQTSLANGVWCPTAGICFATGRESTGALVLEDDNGAWSALALPAGVSGISGASCLSASQCVLTGFGPGGGGTGSVGILLGVNATNGSVTPIALPFGVNATLLTSVTCAASGSSCVVTGTTGGTGVLLSTDGTTATNVLPSTGTTTVVSLNASACSSAMQCFAVGTGTVGMTSVGVILAGSGALWALQTVPSTVTAIRSISCSTQAGASPYMCTTGVTNAGAATLLSTTNGGTTWSLPTTVPSSAIVGPLACTGATACMASLEVVFGTTTTGIVVTSSNGGVTWAASPGFPGGVGTISSLTCPTSGQCVVSGSSGSGAIAVTLSGGTWSSHTLPGAGSFASGAACDSAVHCIAVGESPTGPLAFASSDGGTTWAQASGPAPSGIGTLTNVGLTALGLPLTYQNVQYAGGTNVATPYTTSGAADPTLIANLFPFVGVTGATYSAWSGDCPADQPAAGELSSTLVLPGQYAPNNAALTVPLTYLGLHLVDQFGRPMVGAIVTATVTTGGCAGDVFSLPASGGDGLVEAGLPLGSATPLLYRISATDSGKSGSVNISMSGNGVLDTSSNVTYPYPLAIPVTLS